MKCITVVSALIFNDEGLMLMALRYPTQVPPSRWENPGGKVEEGETERDALVREMQEELGVEVGVGRLVSTASYTWDERFHMLLYRCWIKKGEPKPLESQELRWVNPLQARKQLACLPATYVWYPDIVNALDDHIRKLKTEG